MYDQSRVYTALESGGFALERIHVAAGEGGHVRVTGIATVLTEEAEAA